MIEVQKGVAEAENTLEELGIDQLPIVPSEVVDIISSNDFRVVMEVHDFSSKKILGKAQGNKNAALIYINKNIPDIGRFNFTAAHEVGHVCMHIMPQKKMFFECGNKELSNAFNDPIERQANGFASGLLMPKQLIKKLTDGEINWENISRISSVCASSLEATLRRMLLLSKDPTALVIHQNGEFKRFVVSDNFEFYVENYPLSSNQRELLVDVKEQSYPSCFDEVDASDWVNPQYRGDKLERLYVSSILLNDGFSYSLITYDDDCFSDQ
ncbi:hypothetical protein WH96_09750 [Kiloniella spongiae]|uniref:IrrE N-terminal-like domain-containing protein n=1 Tax=Kiloniella spongiae TaxID=1489064 RepID=A0A0H2MVL9_9PROT|nr:ImmA/IrrE family metallo-endopeptidase [Kiloniella spongiae]KLN60760.1 hypothetical protein WH96_09750 [Kiloniella spongiae]